VTVYDERFYAAQRSGSRRSAEAIVPILLELVEPRSVLDVGCGTGAWLAVCSEHGVEDVLGVDGAHVGPELLQLPSDRFRAHDVAAPLDLGRTFDLALCLEVGEHLAEPAAAVLVESLVRHAPLVLFSAAVPGQLGEGHVNERWQDWWAARFDAHGYVPVDCVRRRVWSDERVEWWYAQNALLYASAAELERRPRLAAEHELMGTGQLVLVHPAYVAWREHVRTRVRRRLAKLLPGRS
jgi:SAM-dependent methyltransferase